jgi:hypothetical protein
MNTKQTIYDTFTFALVYLDDVNNEHSIREVRRIKVEKNSRFATEANTELMYNAIVKDIDTESDNYRFLKDRLSHDDNDYELTPVKCIRTITDDAGTRTIRSFIFDTFSNASLTHHKLLEAV